MAKAKNIGSVISGTMRPEDLIPAFVAELLAQKPLKREHRKLAREIDERSEETGYFESETASWDLEELFDALGEYAPDYFYFGAHPGDGADYGYWLNDEFRFSFERDGGLVVSDTADVPKGYTGEVLHVTDHGNMTLYSFFRGRRREIWGIV